MVFFHSLSKLMSRRGERGVAIVLSPKFTEFYESVGGLPPITTLQDGNNSCGRRYIGIALKMHRTFKCKKGAYRRRKCKKK